MAKAEVSHSEMADARQRDGVSVIFDQDSPASHRSRSQSRSSTSECYRVRGHHRGCYRSSSSSSSYRSHSRSRSRPRCHRRSSRCHCGDHRRYGHGRHRRSPLHRHRAHSRYYSRSSLRDTYSRRRSYRSRSRSYSRSVSRSLSKSASPKSNHRRNVTRDRCRSRSPGYTLSLSLDAKRELLTAAKANVMKTLGVDKIDLPESVKPILAEHTETRQASPEPEKRVRRNPEKPRVSQSDDEEPGDVSSPRTSPKRKIISFSVNNSIAKPTVVAPSSIKVTPRVDSYESRRPYGHWVPVKSGHSSKTRKHSLTVSR